MSAVRDGEVQLMNECNKETASMNLCPLKGCPCSVVPPTIMCPGHWAKVSEVTKARVLAAQAGARVGAEGMKEEYIQALWAAVREVEQQL